MVVESDEPRKKTMKETKIIKNVIRCKICGDIIESKSVHDYRSCSCGKCAVDGGHDYLRRCGNLEDWEDLSVVEAIPEKTIQKQKKRRNPAEGCENFIKN